MEKENNDCNRIETKKVCSGQAEDLEFIMAMDHGLVLKLSPLQLSKTLRRFNILESRSRKEENTVSAHQQLIGLNILPKLRHKSLGQEAPKPQFCLFNQLIPKHNEFFQRKGKRCFQTRENEFQN